MLSDNHVTKFQELYEKRYGVSLGRQEAYEQAAKLLRMVQLVYQPMTQEEFEVVSKS